MSSPLSQEAGELISHVYMGSPLSQEAGELISHIYMSSPLSQEAGELISHIYWCMNIYSCHCFLGLHSTVETSLNGQSR